MSLKINSIKIMPAILPAVFMFLFSFSALKADVATIYPVEDTYGGSDIADVNNGTDTIFGAVYSPPDYYYSFMKFSPSDIPTGTISSAVLYLYCMFSSGNPSMDLQNCDAAWNELALTYNNMPGATGPVLTTAFSDALVNVYYPVDITSIVTAWQTGANNGLRMALTGPLEAVFLSRENGVPYTPYLEINYTPGSPTITTTINPLWTHTFTPTVTPTKSRTPTVTLTPTTAADIYEPDNSYLQASTIISGVQQTHSIIPVGDNDWVTFTLTQPAQITLATNGPGGDDTILSLFDYTASNLLFYDDDSGPGYYSLITATLNPGTYFAEVSEYSSAYIISSYTLDLTVVYIIPSLTPTISPTWSISRTRTISPTLTVSPTITPTPTVTGTPAYAPFPYFTGFETGSFDAYWSAWSSDMYGRIQVTSTYGPYAGAYHLAMDSTSYGSYYTLNEAVLYANLSGVSNPRLRFYVIDFFDENDVLPASFTGHYNGDGVSISGDGVNWYTLMPVLDYATYTQFDFDLDAAITAAGIADRSHIRIKFQQYDNYELGTDGIAFDNVELYSIGTPTYTPTITHTPTISPTWTISDTFTISPTHTVSPTISATFTISPTHTPLPPFTACWDMTPVATFYAYISDQGAVYYDSPTDTIFFNSWGPSTSIYRINPQMTPLASIATNYMELGSRPVRPDGLIYSMRGQPAGGNVIEYNIQLTPVATIPITVFSQPFCWDDKGFGYINNITGIEKINLQLTPVATVLTTNSASSIIPDNARNLVYSGEWNGTIHVYTDQLVQIATIPGSGTSGFQVLNLSPDGHILQTSRLDNFFRVYEPYPSLALTIQYNLTDPRGMDIRSNGDLYMFTNGYLMLFPVCGSPTPVYSPTVTSTRTVSATYTRSFTVTPTRTCTPTRTATPTFTSTRTATPTRTATSTVTLTSTPMTPPPDACWNLTPVSTFTTGIFDQGAVWYDNISDTFLISSWGGNSIYRVNPQMTPLAVITDTYRQMGCRPLRPDGLIYTTRGQPAGGDIFVYNAALTPVATIQITTYAQPISWDENGDGYIPTGFSMLKVNSSLTPVATVNFTNNVLGIIPQAANDKIYVAVYNTGISILNIQLTPQATIASVPAGFQQINVSPDGHIMQTSRSDNWFRVFKPYPDLSLEMQYSLTDPRGFDLRNNDLFMFDTLYFKDYPACATPTFTPTVTPTRTPAVVSVPLEIQNVVPFPHPYNPASASGLSINYFLTRHCNSVKINIYTCAFRQILDETAGNNLASGQKAYTVPADRLALLSNGAYYFYLEGEDAGVTKRSKLQPLIVLRR